MGFSAVPERHSGLGVICCPIINPGMRYPDLMVQRQVIVHLLGEAPPHSREEMDTIRYRAHFGVV